MSKKKKKQQPTIVEEKQIDLREILSLTVEIAEAMLKNGAEIFRVEALIEIILNSYNVEEHNHYIVSNGIFVCAKIDGEQVVTEVRNVPLGSVNLNRIAKLNQLSRDLAAHRVRISDAWLRLREHENEDAYPKWLICVACAFGCGAFCYLSGGNWLDSLVAVFVAAIEQVVIFMLDSHKVQTLIRNMIVAFVVSLLVIVFQAVGMPISSNFVIIGVIFALLPGSAFVTSIRDLLKGDYLSGMIHLMNVIISVVGTAAGTLLPVYIRELFGGVL